VETLKIGRISLGNKKYLLSVTEEMIMNREFDGFRGGRIEVWGDEPHNIYEFRFFLPEWMFESFMEMFDFKNITEKELKHLRLMIEGEKVFE
jgi:hypothetical protein